MKPRLLSQVTAALMLLAGSAIQAAPAPVAGPQIELESKVLCISVAAARRLGLASVDGEAPREKAVLSALKIEEILRSNPANLISAPRITTSNNESGIVSISRELKFPSSFGRASEVRNLGISIEMLPEVKNAGVELNVLLEISYLDGWAGYKDGKTFRARDGVVPEGVFLQPIIGRTRVSSSATLRPGETALLGGFPAMNPAQTGDPLGALKLPNYFEPMLQFVLVSARPITSGDVSPQLKDTEEIVLPMFTQGRN